MPPLHWMDVMDNMEFFYYPVIPSGCHPFINEGEVIAHPYFPFIDEGVAIRKD
jgi:hypothetical protein